MSHQEPGFVSNGQRTFMNLRKANRMAVPPMYSTLAVQAKPFRGAREGHVYDLSESGLRFEIDDPLPVGTDLALEFAVPAAGVIRANARIVRVYDEADDPGPRRMGARFTGFSTPEDEARLEGLMDSFRAVRAA